MKKILLFVLCAVLCATMCFAAPDKGKGPQKAGHGPRMMRNEFGISQETYNKLNLSKAQKTKVEAIKKKYKTEFKKGEKPDFAKMRANNEKKNSEFRATLTPAQKKIYDKDIADRKAKRKEFIAKMYNGMADELKFSKGQKQKLAKALAEKGDNPQAINAAFSSIMTADQAITWQKKIEARSKNMKSGIGPGKGPGFQPKGQKKPNKK